MRRYIVLAALWVVFASASGCDAVGPVNAPPPLAPTASAPLADVLGSATAFATFARVVAETGIDGGATTLAPDDQAFALMSPESLDGLRAVRALDKVARRHVLTQPLDPAALADGDQLATLEGTPISVHVTDEGVVFLDGARLGDVIGTTPSGPVYRLGRVLRDHLTVAERLGASPLVSRSAALFRSAGVDLSRPGTYLVPIDLGYDRVLGGYPAFTRPSNTALTTRTLGALYLPGAPRSAAELRAGEPEVATGLGTSLSVEDRSGLLVLGDEARIVATDIRAAGAVIHLVDVPPQGHLTLLERIAFVPELSSFSALLTQSGVGEALREPGPFTVFTTPNDAFDRLGEEARQALAAEPALRRLVAGYQVSPGLIPASALPGVFPTLTDQRTRVTPNPVTGQSNTLSGATPASFVDLPAANGRLHVVDQLLNPVVSLYDQLLLSGFGRFRHVAAIAGYRDLLSSGTPVTVIAPRTLTAQLLLPAFECRAREVARDHIIPAPTILSPLSGPFDTSNLNISIVPNVGSSRPFLVLQELFISVMPVQVPIGRANVEFANLVLEDGSVLHGVDVRMRTYGGDASLPRSTNLPTCPS